MYATARALASNRTVPSPCDDDPALRPHDEADGPDLILEGVQAPFRRDGRVAPSDHWLPGPARLCVVVGDGTISVQLRHRTFSPIPRFAIIGPTDRAHRIIADGADIVSFVITPLGWARLFRRPACNSRNMVVALESIAHAPIAMALKDILLTKVEAVSGAPTFRDVLQPMTPPHRDEQFIHRLMRLVDDARSVQVGDMHQQFGLSEARLRALALRHFGSPTKMLLRRARFLRSLARVNYAPGENSYSDIDDTYHDIPHFLRDSDYFLGTTPRRFKLLSSEV